ncbi:efflux transporter periplasmic adaptor subunit [Prevotella sp. P5-92]|uniref:efflux RND transporter periplasmic adaptor subunit n=1 Tax=Prevotella sp. P5-92 TaxID=2024222 RepID=UPI000B96DA63|nr:HlyD family efflux transporter periplasmic adaptor subunit [Prevotella sp. P5-92]OYP59184.1 efflux transporter periplasmic adaptor subunit [Prevotella sp. P5-92]
MDIRIKKKPWYRRYLYHIAGGTALAALVIYATIISLEPQKVKLSDTKEVLASAEMRDFTEYLDVEGIVQPIMTIQVNTMESGFVERIVAEDGAMLNEGDTILILGNPELLHSIEDENDAWEDSERRYREQEIEMQQKSIVLRQQSLDANYQLASIEKSLQQSREEYRMGIKSKAELEVAEKNYEYQKKKALLQLESLGHDSVSARLMREMAVANRQASDKKRARSAARTRNLVVRAPVAGQLSFLGVTPGQQVGSGVKVGEIKIMTQFKIKVSLNEFYIDRIANGLPASVKYEEKTYPMRISQVVPEVKEKKFDCSLVFTGEMPENIRIGKSYRVQIGLGIKERTLVIPRGDFLSTTGGLWIYKLDADGSRAVKTEIETGRQNPQQIEILSGLKAGDRVIIGDYDKLNGENEVYVK